MNPFVIHCPACEAKLKVRKRELVGRRVPCPRCGEAVRVKAPKQAVKEDENTVDLDVRSLKKKPPRRKPKQPVLPRRRAKKPPRHRGLMLAAAAASIVIVAVAGIQFVTSGDPEVVAVDQSQTVATETAASRESPAETPARPTRTSGQPPRRQSATGSNRQPDAPVENSKQPRNDFFFGSQAEPATDSPATEPDSQIERERSDAQPRTSEPPVAAIAEAEPIAFTVNAADFNKTGRPFLVKHCVSCHGPKKQSAKLRLDQLEPDFGDLSLSAKWTEVLDRVNAGEMPPEDAPQPDQQALREFTAWVTSELERANAARQSTGGQVVLRRLNRNEYRNTIRDLLGIDFDTDEKFPEDPPASGFDNIGAALTVSPLLIEKYLHAAREILDRVFAEQPPRQRHRWRFEVDLAATGSNKPGVDTMDIPDEIGGQSVRAKVQGGKNPVRNGSVIVRQEGWQQIVGVRDIRFNKPSDYEPGDYIVRVRAAGVIPTRRQVIASAERMWQRRNGMPPHMRPHFEKSPLYDYGAPRMKVTDATTQSVLGEVDATAPPDRPQVYEFRGDFKRGLAVSVANVYRIPANLSNHWFRLDDEFAAPDLLVDWIEIEGPIPDEAAATARQRILSAFGAAAKRGSEGERAETILREFMTRAWRRPVTSDEVAAKVALFQQARSSKARFEESLNIPLIVTLTSPNFLFLTEPRSDSFNGKPQASASDTSDRRNTDASGLPLNDRGSRQLSSHELASRLSYFLSSSLPDDELFTAAASGQLNTDRNLTAQADRLLAAPQSRRFVRNFAGQWLALRDVGTNSPARGLFPRYDDHLEESMVRESQVFFSEILHNDLSVMNFVKSDFVTINERLARFYGIPGVKGDDIRRVAVPQGIPRGGVMAQASVLTVTSNGTRTVPVWRGVWVLENILGERIPPPPPNAGEIAQLTPGNQPTTIRARMEQHRQVAACAACHDKIDPLGFALENFRGDGGWATQEANGWGGSINRNDPVIDASGRLPDGRAFNGVQELQQILLKEEDRFLRCLTEKMVTYALGRAVEFTDREWIEQLVTHIKSNRYTLRSLIHGIVLSPQFRST